MRLLEYREYEHGTNDAQITIKETLIELPSNCVSVEKVIFPNLPATANLFGDREKAFHCAWRDWLRCGCRGFTMNGLWVLLMQNPTRQPFRWWAASMIEGKFLKPWTPDRFQFEITVETKIS